MFYSIYLSIYLVGYGSIIALSSTSVLYLLGLSWIVWRFSDLFVTLTSEFFNFSCMSNRSVSNPVFRHSCIQMLDHKNTNSRILLEELNSSGGCNCFLNLFWLKHFPFTPERWSPKVSMYWEKESFSKFRTCLVLFQSIFFAKATLSPQSKKPVCSPTCHKPKVGVVVVVNKQSPTNTQFFFCLSNICDKDMCRREDI